MGAISADLLLSPFALALLGLCVGSFLNVVVHRLPLMLERQWWSEVAHQLADRESWQRVFGSSPSADHDQRSSAISGAIDGLGRLSLVLQ